MSRNKSESVMIGKDWGDYLVNFVLQSVLFSARLIPYRYRVPLVGWLAAHLIARVAGYRPRIRSNLSRILPELPEKEVARLIRQVPYNVGRTLIEVYSGAEFIANAMNAPIRGEGLGALEAARGRGQGVILVSGHFGNYDVPRGVLAQRGFAIGALYKPWANRYFDRHYRRIIGEISAPVFPLGRQGLSEMVRFLRQGGMVGILPDQAISGAPYLDFMGQPARTPLSAADLALRYGLLLVPVYGVRECNGLGFELIIEAPIPHSDASSMMQAVNDSLAAQVRAHPDQWLWIHQRWK
jgi:KDO2-lipid IV(A) lauroyltransferase